MKTKQQFCIPIIKSSKSEVLSTIEQNENTYQFFEIWLDYIEDLDVRFVTDLEKKLKDKLIILFRRQNLEKPHMKEPLKSDILKALNKSKVSVDFDIKSQLKDVQTVTKQKLVLQLILSYHNYKKTPTDAVLKNLLKQMQKYNPHIYKISAFCNSDNDAIRLLQILVSLKQKNRNCIILGMGNNGIYTRVCGMFLGNEFSFAPNTIEEASAPGQLTRTELQEIAKILSRKFD